MITRPDVTLSEHNPKILSKVKRINKNKVCIYANPLTQQQLMLLYMGICTIGTKIHIDKQKRVRNTFIILTMFKQLG